MKREKNKITRYNPSKNSSKIHPKHKTPENSLLLKATQALEHNDYSEFCKLISQFASSVETVLAVDFFILITSLVITPVPDKYLSYIKALPKLNKFFGQDDKIQDSLIFEIGEDKLQRMFKSMDYALLDNNSLIFLKHNLSIKAYNYIVEKNVNHNLSKFRHLRLLQKEVLSYGQAFDNKKKQFLDVFAHLDNHYNLGKHEKFKKTLNSSELEQIKLDYFFQNFSLIEEKKSVDDMYEFKFTPNLSLGHAKEIFKNLKISSSIASKNFNQYYYKIKDEAEFSLLYLDKLNEKSLINEKILNVDMRNINFFLDECVKRGWFIEKIKNKLNNKTYFGKEAQEQDYRDIISAYCDKQKLDFSVNEAVRLGKSNSESLNIEPFTVKSNKI